MKRFFSVCLALCFLLGCAILPVSAADTPVFSAGTASARAGESVQIPIEIENNPGIVSFKVSVSYDSALLTLQNAQTDPIFTEGSFTISGTYALNPFNIIWLNPLGSDCNQNGTFAVLTFAIAEDAPVGDIPIQITYSAPDTFNSELQEVSLSVQNGSVTVLPAEVGGWSFSEDSTLMTYEGESGVNFVCGLDELDPVVSDYVETTGGWSFEVIPNDLGNESTGAQLVIYDETGEEVESYEIVMFGDVTGDCIIDASDCSLTLSLMVGEGEYGDFLMVDEGAHPFAADTDHNGMLDASDISVILEMAVGDSEWGQTL